MSWLADPDEAVFRESALAAGLAHCIPQLVTKPAVVAYQGHLQSDAAKPEPPTLVPASKGKLVARRHSDHVDLFLAITRKFVKKSADYGQLAVHLRLYDDHASRRAKNFEASWRQFLQAWNLLQFHEHVVASSELIELDGPVAKIVVPTISKPIPEPPADTIRPSVRAELLGFLEEFPELEGLFVGLTRQDLPAPDEPGDQFILGGTPRDVDLYWPDLRITISLTYDDDEISQLQALGWLAFNPETEAETEQARVVEAIVQRIGT
ncbi:MAG: hypothetical protein ACPG4T_08655 [Nannocystaceae bacterium]